MDSDNVVDTGLIGLDDFVERLMFYLGVDG
jgi:hypothetical protein